MLKFGARVKGLKKHSQVVRILVQSLISSGTKSIHLAGWTANKTNVARGDTMKQTFCEFGFVPNKNRDIHHIPHIRIMKEVVMLTEKT